MSVSAVNNIGSLQSLLGETDQKQRKDSAVSFGSILDSAIDSLNQAENTVSNNEYQVATGQIDDLHTVTMNLSKAELAVYTVVQVRNKVLDAYNEIMSVTL